ncbi:hypothetical protein DMB68_06915 [Flavobacterium hydrophilum]|uniref:Uncharacterized protein n=1 Tax=Flavobacterium hydrophilum TaxID=2211445 RepID=A0A2V4C8A8_9FLAO|nr:hypothetical protein DMB68_06915 [Flavobacterium hydrophilum]
MYVFHWFYKFGLDVLLGIEGNVSSKNKSLTSFIKTALACVTKLEAVLHLQGRVLSCTFQPKFIVAKKVVAM